eukprot:TRINITY_DN1947_c0_g1_i5.p2 TRINITY_DN1947_c0_g1~~TRINITY_DN1947_c0_g1_i5.p2  ORF type:complete len:102 (-),score=12.19 TRINITY_DN1947_c0_g1_i5:81-386(-)
MFHVVFQSAIALATAHSLGIFHSDIKPNNMLYLDGCLKLIDFDVSSKLESQTFVNRYTTKLTGKMKGFTETYSPPEQLYYCLLYTSPSPRDLSTSRMPSSA